VLFKRFQHLPFILILILALFVRAYKLPTLTTFGRDQGIDFLSVRQMIVTHHPTLLGIKVSLADFHQGPVYLYMLIPLFWLLGLHPIAGAVTAVAVAGLTVVALYLFLMNFFDRSTALLSCLLFAVSPELVKYGNTPLYQHFLPLAFIFCMWALLLFLEANNVFKKRIWMTVLGIVVGLSLELHFLAITLCVATPILILLKNKKDIVHLPFYLGGLLIGMSPTILFEVRHDFLNTRLLWQYLSSSSSSASYFNPNIVMPWLTGAAAWLGAEKYILGWFVLLSGVFSVFKVKSTNLRYGMLQQLLVTLTGVTIILQLALTSFEPHYALPIWLLLIILLPLWLSMYPQPYKFIAYTFVSIIILANAVTVVTRFSQNHGYSMPVGWSLTKIISTTTLIADDVDIGSGVNVASLLDGDTRAYPLRYTLAHQGIELDSVEKYPESRVLYVVTTKNAQQLLAATEWEITSFQPAVIGQEWDLGDHIKLYRLDKSKH
jgi:4-amino-4-deoxy-L-arabinose transferase-like glycosyltransferase